MRRPVTATSTSNKPTGFGTAGATSLHFCTATTHLCDLRVKLVKLVKEVWAKK